MRSLLVAGLFAVLASPALAQQIEYEKYTLPNGMTVILHEDHTLPVAAVNIWYAVGSKDEPPKRSGFAHLFEHLMFMGTERVPGNQFDIIMESGGGSNNASTSTDRTNYFSSGPANLLPTLLWLDADRLEDLGRTMTQEKLDLQRDVVRNERRETENSPYGDAEILIPELMYPAGHPYHISVIGSHEDLEAAAVSDVTEFFANYYVPANASLVVVGDFDAAAVKPLINGLFGTIPAAPEPTHRAAEPVKLDRVVRQTLLDDVQLPRLSLVYHSPAYYAPGDAEMDLTAAVLTAGKSSRLYKRLVLDDRLAADVSAAQYSAQLGSLFQIDILAVPGADLAAIERAADEEIARLLSEGPSDEELARHRATVELGKLQSLQSVLAKADKLNEYEHYFGEPDSFERDLDRYRNATAAGVRDWSRKVLTPDARLIVRVLPEAPERTAAPRDQRPKDWAPPEFSPAPPETFTLSSGVPVMLWPKPQLPLVSMRLLLVPGGPLDTPAHAGLAELTAQMLDEGTGELDALAFSEAMQSLGAQFSAGAGEEAVTVSLDVLKRNFPRAVRLAGDAALRPRMADEDWQRVKRLHLEQLRQDEDTPTVVAARVARRLLLGDSHPLARPAVGTPETIESASLEEARKAHAALFNPASAAILVAGDLTAEEARKALEPAFGSWDAPDAPAAARPVPPAPEGEGLRLAIVDRPGAVQTVIRFAAPGIPIADERRVPLRVLNTLLGGSFTSRLNQNLREQHGYTYGARSRFEMLPSAGQFVAGASVRADVTGPAVAEFLKEFARLKAGDITPEEAARARETLRTDVIEPMQSLGGVLDAAAELVSAGLPFEAVASDLAAAAGIDAQRLNAAARDAIDLDRGVLVLVGDKRTILEQLEELDLPDPVLVDEHGDPAGE